MLAAYRRYSDHPINKLCFPFKITRWRFQMDLTSLISGAVAGAIATVVVLQFIKKKGN
jgi:hypothetical protein